MLEIRTGDIFQCLEAQVIVNPSNTQGRMGKGLALTIKNRFRWSLAPYEAACANRTHQPGTTLLVRNPGVGWPLGVVHVPTKRFWRDPSRLSDVAAALHALVHMAKRDGIESVALPALGCGNGKLPWAEVKPLMEQILGPSPCRFYAFEPVE